MEKFRYLGDMISCYGGALETVSPRIVSAWEKLGSLVVCYLGAGFIFEAMGDELSFLC